MTEPQKMGVDPIFTQIQKCLWILIARASDQAHGLVPYAQVEGTKDAIENAISSIIADRDALRERVGVLEGAVVINWAARGYRCYYCVFCSEPSDESLVKINHAPDCIVRTIQEAKR